MIDSQLPQVRNRFKSAIVVLYCFVAAALVALPSFGRMTMSSSAVKVEDGSRSHDIPIIDPNPEEPLPKVAWLMTFPNSGTTYTLKLIQQYTNTTTATNYGNEQGRHGTNTLIRSNLDQGPFPRHPEGNMPSKYILTKTHCGGTCLGCSNPSDYVETVRSFEIECSMGNRVVNDTKTYVLYSASIPQRAVHLIRNPFDNFVARLHLQQKRFESRNKAEQMAKFNNSKEGFRAWCKSHDRMGVKDELASRYIDDELWSLAKDLPCHAEFIRYTWWHNLVIEVTRQRKMPVHSMYYEDFSHDWNKTVDELFRFLELAPANGAEPPEFITGKHYGDYFEPHHVELAGRLVKLLASRESWALLSHYF